MAAVTVAIVDAKALGVVPFEGFIGATAAEKWASVKAFYREPANSKRPVLQMSNGFYDLSGTATEPLDIAGLKMVGPGSVGETEFGYSCEVKVPATGLWSVPPAAAKDFRFKGIGFLGTSNGAFVAPSAQSAADGDWKDLSIEDCGFKGFGPTFFQAALTRANFQRWYVNSGTDTRAAWGGSDCTFFTNGVAFMSSAQQGARQELINTGGLANSAFGKIYLTPQGGRGLVVGNGRMGLTFDNFTSTDPNRTGLKQTQGAAITVQGGEGVTFRSPVIFCANAGTTDGNPDPGDITVTGGHSHVFDAPVFVGNYSGVFAPNVSQACIYTTVSITVIAPIAVGSRPKILREATAGLIDLVGAGTGDPRTPSGTSRGWKITTG